MLESAGIDHAGSKALIGSVGRLTRQKGFDVLLKAFARLKQPECALLITGVGEEEPALRGLSTQLGIQDRVHFIGYRRDVPAFLKTLDLYVHPARFEGMPNALLEAMAAGCPIVATSVDGSTELIEDGVHGWLVPPENPDALGYAIDAALRDQNEARRRGIAARQKATCHFSIETMINAWEHILQQQGGSP
jgi:glycosyltransferase involved in cell wall biosynthesis